jgi:two-component system cell cycle sensor histidine kinase/response regulator CckA
MLTKLKISNHEKDQIKKVSEYLTEIQSRLADKLSESFLSSAFENRFTLHPRQLKELGLKEVENFKAFLQSLNTSRVIEQGKEHAQQGLGEKPFLSIGNIFRQLLIDKIKQQNVEHLQTAIKVIDMYTNSYLYGYMTAREDQTLNEQEQLRKALSTALNQHRRELFIKTHAIHTYINGIMLTDLEGNVTYVNPAFLRMWRLDDSDKVLHLQSTRFLGATDFNVIMSMLKTRDGWQNEFTANCQDGSSFELVISASLIKDDTNQLIGVMASFIDVTERKRLEAQFRQAQKMEALGQLAGGIVHDFNNLLQVISGYTSLEMMDAPKDSDHYNNLMQIKVATERGSGLTEQLRFFTRQDTGKARTLHLNDVVNETYNLLKRTFQPEIQINLQLDPDLHAIKADPSQLSQLLMNLCVNARDAMVESKDTIKTGPHRKASKNILTIETYNIDIDEYKATRYLNGRPGKYICIKVSDTGVGMHPEVIERLFEPFFTTKSEKTGIGLGLAVVYGIVHNHNGFFDVHSKFGEGSKFEIFLPVLEETTKDVVAEQQKTSLTYGKGAVLIVDDESQMRELAVKTLEQCGYKTIVAEDGVEALSLYRSRKNDIDLVILDVIMPKMGGWECFHRLKEYDPEVKILIMTGYTTDSSVEGFLKEGAKEVIMKPFDLEAFTNSVNSALNT